MRFHCFCLSHLHCEQACWSPAKLLSFVTCTKRRNIATTKSMASRTPCRKLRHCTIKKQCSFHFRACGHVLTIRIIHMRSLMLIYRLQFKQESPTPQNRSLISVYYCSLVSDISWYWTWSRHTPSENLASHQDLATVLFKPLQSIESWRRTESEPSKSLLQFVSCVVGVCVGLSIRVMEPTYYAFMLLGSCEVQRRQIAVTRKTQKKRPHYNE